jgi:tRNA-dihydrouridine synthase C
MEGVIDHTLRELLTGLGGLDRCVTEFVRVSDLLLPPRVFYRYCPELHAGGTTTAGTPVFVQLLGGQPSPMAENAAQAVALGAPGIDLNFGCPARTVNRSDGGSVLLKQPQRVHDIVAAVRQAVPRHIPVTVKIRLGYDDRRKLRENSQAIAGAGASELTIHARTKADGYRVPAYWEDIARVREWIDLPLVANGEIWSVEDALRCREVSGVQDLMLGRGVLSRPDLARLIRARDLDEQVVALDWPRVRQLLIDYFEVICANYRARYVGNPIKQWLVYLRNYFPQAAQLFSQLKRLREPAEIRAALRELN